MDYLLTSDFKVTNGRLFGGLESKPIDISLLYNPFDVLQVSPLLSKQEIVRFSRMAHPISQKAFLMGRLVAQNVFSLYQKEYKGLAIVNSSNGRPQYFVNEKEQEGTLSISHKDTIAGALYGADFMDIGLDIENDVSRPTIQSMFEPKDVKEVEKQAELNNPEVILWTIYESLFKAQSHRRKIAMKDVSIQDIHWDSGLILTSATTASENWKIVSFRRANFWVTIAMLRDSFLTDFSLKDLKNQKFLKI